MAGSDVIVLGFAARRQALPQGIATKALCMLVLSMGLAPVCHYV